MSKLVELLKKMPSNSSNYKLVVNGNPVWDYKHRTNTNTVSLISDNLEDIPEQEHVSIKELKRFISKSLIPTETLDIRREFDDKVIEYVGTDDETKTINLETNE